MGLAGDVFRLALQLENRWAEIRDRHRQTESAAPVPWVAPPVLEERKPLMRTLCIDIGGTGIKAIVVGEDGEALSQRHRVETPAPAVPGSVLDVVEKLAELAGAESPFERVSVGFPGVVIDGVARTAPNLDRSWAGVPVGDEVSRRLGKPVKVANDAGIQGLGVIEGRGLEMVITLGTGLGCGLYIDGHYVPNLELAHHPFKKKATYEDRVGNAARKKIGDKKWNRRVREVIGQIEPIFNYRALYVGGGNARRLEAEGLPANVKIVDNAAGLFGGIRLWRDEGASSVPESVAPPPARLELPAGEPEQARHDFEGD